MVALPATGPAYAEVLRSRSLAAATTAALIVVGLAWELWLAPTGRGTWAIKVLPLAVALPGVWRLRLYTYRWLSLLAWLYVTEGIVRATTERGPVPGLALVQLALALVLFAACAWHVRARFRNAATQGQTQTTAG